MKNVLVIANKAPFDHTYMREALDMTLIFAAIEQNISLLFQGPAVLSLKQGQTPEALKLKNYFKTFGTLSLYDVEHVYVCENSLQRYSLTLNDLTIDDVTALDENAKKCLTQQQDFVVTL